MLRTMVLGCRCSSPTTKRSTLNAATSLFEEKQEEELEKKHGQVLFFFPVAATLAPKAHKITFLPPSQFAENQTFGPNATLKSYISPESELSLRAHHVRSLNVCLPLLLHLGQEGQTEGERKSQLLHCQCCETKYLSNFRLCILLRSCS